MVTEVDPFGVVLAVLKADPGVTAIAPAARVSSEFTSAPCVVLSDLTDTLSVFGPNSTRLGLQRWLGVAKAYGTDSPSGAIAARQLGSAVRAALHGKRYFRGTNNRYIVDISAPDMAGLERDPQTHHPHYDVTVDALGSREAFA